MMFDNSKEVDSEASSFGDHVALAIVIGGALAVAIGMHFAALTLATLGAVHLLLGGLVIAVRSKRAKRKAGSR